MSEDWFPQPIASFRSGKWETETYVLRCVFGIEDVGGDDVTDGVCGIERGIVHSLLGLSGAVAADPGQHQRVDGEDQVHQVEADEEARLVRLRLGEDDQESNADDDDGDQTEEERRLALEAVRQVGRDEDGAELKRSGRHVQEDGRVGGETDEALEDDGAEDGSDGSAGIDGDDHDEEQPVLGLAPGLEDLLPVELVRHDALLVGLETVDGLETVLGGEVAGLSGAVVGPEVGHQADDDGDETEEEVDDLVAEEGLGVDASEPIHDRGAQQGAQAVAAVPARDPERLLGTPVEGNGNDGEVGDDGGLKGAQEEAGDEEAGVGARSAETAGDGDAPAGDDDGQHDAIADLDDRPGGQGLHAELRVVADVADVGVVVAVKIGVGLEAVDGRQADDALVRRLEEVDDAEQGEHVKVGLAKDAPAVLFGAEVRGGQRVVLALLEGDGEAGGIVVEVDIVARAVVDVLEVTDGSLLQRVVVARGRHNPLYLRRRCKMKKLGKMGKMEKIEEMEKI